MEKETKGFVIMFIALFLLLGMITWTSLTLQDGKNYIETTHNGASCLMGGWCGGIPVLVATPFVFAVVFFIFVYGYGVVERSRKEKDHADEQE